MSAYPRVQVKVEEVTVAMASIQMHPQSVSGSVAASDQSSLVLRRKTPAPDKLISEDMGFEIVTLYVGAEQVPFSVHKNLIVATSACFADFFHATLAPGQKHILRDDDVEAFKLFVEYMYGKRIPGLTASMSASDMAHRIKNLCRLYTFSDKYYLKFEIRNRIMDRIQDGFVMMGKFPEPGLVRGIYANSAPDSKLRRFVLAGVYYGFRNESVKAEEFKALLQKDPEVLDDFLEYIRSAPAERDPRIRQCYGWEGCNECAEYIGGYARIEGLGGVFPCQYHIHKGTLGQLKEVSTGPPGTNIDYVESADDGCYLWDSFPDMEHIVKYRVAGV